MPSLVRKPVPARPQPPTAPPPQQRGAGGRPVPVITPDTSQVMPVRGLFWREGPPDMLSSAIISPRRAIICYHLPVTCYHLLSSPRDVLCLVCVHAVTEVSHLVS